MLGWKTLKMVLVRPDYLPFYVLVLCYKMANYLENVQFEAHQCTICHRTICVEHKKSECPNCVNE